MSLSLLSIAALRKKLLAKEITPSDILEDLISAIEKTNPEIGAYINWNVDAAREAAKNADITLPLGGIPIAIKDNINVLGEPCACASKFLENAYTSPYDATVITKLREAGAIPFGRVNMDEFAMGSSTDNSAIQQTNNPHDLSRVVGGSSGGSAASVASHSAIAALGSDTGGSIRQPASHCGVVGLKPSYGRISRYGLVAFASSLDQIGPLTKTVEDSALLLNAMCGHDPADSTSLVNEIPDFTQALDKGVKGLKIGLPKEYFFFDIDPRIKEKLQNVVTLLKDAGAEIIDISLPHTEYVVATYYIIAPAEASSNLSRFDGIRYGNRSEGSENLIDLYRKSRSEGFGPEVKRRIILGTYVLSSGHEEQYYHKAQKVCTLIREDFNKAFDQVDVILCPTTPTIAPTHEESGGDPLTEYLSDIFTIAANLAGICGISVPAGNIQEGGANLPVGVQLLGPHLGEEKILQVAASVEKLQKA